MAAAVAPHAGHPPPFATLYPVLDACAGGLGAVSDLDALGADALAAEVEALLSASPQPLPPGPDRVLAPPFVDALCYAWSTRVTSVAPAGDATPFRRALLAVCRAGRTVVRAGDLKWPLANTGLGAVMRDDVELATTLLACPGLAPEMNVARLWRVATSSAMLSTLEAHGGAAFAGWLAGTPLHACSPVCVPPLLRRGANPDAVDATGRRALTAQLAQLVRHWGVQEDGTHVPGHRRPGRIQHVPLEVEAHAPRGGWAYTNLGRLDGLHAIAALAARSAVVDAEDVRLAGVLAGAAARGAAEVGMSHVTAYARAAAGLVRHLRGVAAWRRRRHAVVGGRGT